MTLRVEYFLTMGSPWAYLGHAAFMDAMGRLGVEVAILIVPLKQLFPETGGLPLQQRHSSRQAYRLMDLRRWRRRRGLSLTLQPKHFPFDPSLLDRVVIAALNSGVDADPLMRAAFRAIWTEDRDLADPGTIAVLLQEVGLADELVVSAEANLIAACYDDNLGKALSVGVFGAPSYVLGAEVFWGQDRIDFLIEEVKSRFGELT